MVRAEEPTIPHFIRSGQNVALVSFPADRCRFKLDGEKIVWSDAGQPLLPLASTKLLS